MWKREAAELVDPHRLIPDDPNLVEEIATLYATEVALKASQKKLETADLAVRRTVQLCHMQQIHYVSGRVKPCASVCACFFFGSSYFLVFVWRTSLWLSSQTTHTSLSCAHRP